MLKQLDLNKLVIYSNPLEGEEKLEFEVVNYNEKTNRVQIKVVNSGLSIPPIELVSIDDIKNK